MHTCWYTGSREVAKTPVFRRDVISPAWIELNNHSVIVTMYKNL